MTNVNDVNMNKENLFKEYQSELNFLKSWIESKNLSNKQVEDIKKIIYNWFIWFEKNIPEKQKKIFELILTKLNTPNESLNSQDIDDISSILLLLENIQIEKADLEKLEESIKDIKNIKSSLNILKKNIVSNMTPEQKQLKEKVLKYKEKLMLFSVEHPIWTKALILLLPAKLVFLFKWTKEDEIEKTKNKLWWQALSWKLSEIKNFFWKFNKFLAQMATLFFSWFAPKEMKELLANMKADFANVDIWMLEKLNGIFVNVKEKVEDYNDNEKIKQDVDSQISKFKIALKEMIEKKFKKTINMEKIDQIVEKMELSNLIQESEIINLWKKVLGENVSWNWVDSFIASWILPFKLFYKLTKVLIDEKIISLQDVSFSIVNWIMHYGYKWINLFWVWQEMIVWKIDFENLKAELSQIYDKSPDEAKEILANMVYRTWWPVLNIFWNLSKYISSIIFYWLLDTTKLSDTFDILKDSLKWEINTNIKNLNEIKEIIPDKNFNLTFSKQLENLRNTIYNLEQSSKFVKVYNNLRNQSNIPDFLQEFENEYKKLFPKENINITQIKEFLGINKWWTKDLKNLIQIWIIDKISWIWEGLDKGISEVDSFIWKQFKWINSWSYVLNNVAQTIKESTHILVKTIKDDTLFQDMKRQFSKFNLAITWMELIQDWNKIKYKFQNVDSLSKFVENLKILSLQSPEILKFLIWKIPIFIVAWLNWEWDTLPDKIINVWSHLKELIPILWPFLIMRDWADFENPDYSQMSIWAVLLTMDWFFAIKAIKNKDFLKFLLNPFIDVAEIIWYMSRAWFSVVKMTIDWVKLASNKNLIEKILNTIKKEKSKKSVVIIWAILLLLLWSDAYDSITESIKDIPEEIKNNKNNPEKLEEIIKTQWKILDINSKKELIKIAIYHRLWLTNEKYFNNIDITDTRYIGKDKNWKSIYENKLWIDLKGDLEKLLSIKWEKWEFKAWSYYLDVRSKIYEYLDSVES